MVKLQSSLIGFFAQNLLLINQLITSQPKPKKLVLGIYAVFAATFDELLKVYMIN